MLSKLTQMLTDKDRIECFTFEEFLSAITDVYTDQPRKRTMVVRVMMELSLLIDIRRIDVMDKAMCIIEDTVSPQQMGAIKDSVDTEMIHQFIITDSFLVILFHNCELHDIP